MPETKVGNTHSNTKKMVLNLQKQVLQKSEVFEKSSMKLYKSKILLSRIKRKILKHVYVLRVFLVFTILALLIVLTSVSTKLLRNSRIGFYYQLAKNFVFVPKGDISSINGRTNILILGKGGDGHEAPDLTDTMIFASIKNSPSGKLFNINGEVKISMISLPRDIWVTPLRTKLNSVYYWGKQRQPNDGGLILAKSTVEEIVGQSVQYGVVVNFNGFKKIIDVLGGISVDVKNSFTDTKFPITGRENDLCEGDLEYKCRYETVIFNKGLQKMNGDTALKFVRSRHADGDEGTDLARAARQEVVIEAIKNKALTKEVYLNPKRIIELKDAVLSSIETDITPQVGAILARWLLEGRNSVNSSVLEAKLLENPPKMQQYDNLYVFIPKLINETEPGGRSWLEVQEWVKCVLEENKQC